MEGHEADMTTFDDLEQCVREALTHLYDPAYRPPELLGRVLGREGHEGLEGFQEAMIRAVADLEPAPNVPSTARSRRLYGLLSCHYVQDLTQEETAERLGISPRHLRRELPEAVHALALRLWEESGVRGSVRGELGLERKTPGLEPATAEGGPTEWRSQVRQELASLHDSAPGRVADVGETVSGVVYLARALTAGRSIDLEVQRVQPALLAAIHPSVLRQVLITAVRWLTQHMGSGQITLSAGRVGGNVTITISGHPISRDTAPNEALMREILAAQDGTLEVSTDDDRVSFHVGLPSVEQVVLVVDDNPDMLHLYKRYVVGTPYHIVHTAQGQSAFKAIEASTPDIIVLDVMLPDLDGWELLGNLREHPTTRSIPIIVCSVIREQDLALALGATLYLSKPVQRQQFIQALDQALDQA